MRTFCILLTYLAGVSWEHELSLSAEKWIDQWGKKSFLNSKEDMVIYVNSTCLLKNLELEGYFILVFDLGDWSSCLACYQCERMGLIKVMAEQEESKRRGRFTFSLPCSPAVQTCHQPGHDGKWLFHGEDPRCSLRRIRSEKMYIVEFLWALWLNMDTVLL